MTSATHSRRKGLLLLMLITSLGLLGYLAGSSGGDSKLSGLASRPDAEAQPEFSGILPDHQAVQVAADSSSSAYREVLGPQAPASLGPAPGSGPYRPPTAPSWLVRGLVVDGTDSASIFDVQWRGPSKRGECKTDALGQFEFRIEEAGNYWLTVTGADKSLMVHKRLSRSPGQWVSVEFESGSIAGRVLGPDEVGLEGVQLRLKLADGGGGVVPRFDGKAVTSATGAFEFKGLPAGRFVLEARKLNQGDFSWEGTSSEVIWLGKREVLLDFELSMSKVANPAQGQSINLGSNRVIHSYSKRLRGDLRDADSNSGNRQR